MKLNNIVENKTDKETFEKFWQYVDNNSNMAIDLKLNENGEIVAGENTTVRLRTGFGPNKGPSSGSRFDFIHNGKLTIKFASVEGSITLSDLHDLKTLVNLPPIIGDTLCFENIKNVKTFDLDIKKCDTLEFMRCDFYDLTNIRNVENKISVFAVNSITGFDVLPGTRGENCVLQLERMSIDSSIKNNNKDLTNLFLRSIQQFKNFENLPPNIKKLKCRFIYDFESFVGIDKYDSLTSFDLLNISDQPVIKSVITLLLCKQLTSINIETFNKKVDNIISLYMRYTPTRRSENIMDCAIELIDAGFEEAAEL